MEIADGLRKEDATDGRRYFGLPIVTIEREASRKAYAT